MAMEAMEAMEAMAMLVPTLDKFLVYWPVPICPFLIIAMFVILIYEVSNGV